MTARTARAAAGIACLAGACSASPARVASSAQIAVQGTVQAGSGSIEELFTMNLDGTDRVQITNDGTNKFLPHFSPDATRLLYTRFATGGYGQAGSQADVAVYDFTEKRQTILTASGMGFQPVWSPDGKQIAYDTFGSSLHVMNADGTGDHVIGTAAGTDLDKLWGDPAWSSDDWIVFTVAELVANGTCFRVRADKMRPDGSQRTQVSDGGSDCTPMGYEQSGDADPGVSPDGMTIYSSRGFPMLPAGATTAILPSVERKLYAFSTDPWAPGKIEHDLSWPAEPDCIEGVPKASPDGTRVLVFRVCFDGGPAAQPGTYLTDTAGSYRTFVIDGFGADWNPVASK